MLEADHLDEELGGGRDVDLLDDLVDEVHVLRPRDDEQTVGSRVGDDGDLASVMRGELMRTVRNRKGFLSSLDDSELAKLVAARLPKESGAEALGEDALSLHESLGMLADVDDLSAALSEAKGELKMVTGELRVVRSAMKALEGRTKVEDLIYKVFYEAVQWCCDCVARHSLPCLGNDGGLRKDSVKKLEEVVREQMWKFKNHLERIGIDEHGVMRNG